MACPKCGSEEWKLASLVYSEGIHNLSTSTNFVGSGLGDDAFGVGIGTGVGRGKTSWIQQTRLSDLAAPPVKPPPPAKILSSKKPSTSLKLFGLNIAAIFALIFISQYLGFNATLLPSDVKIILTIAMVLPPVFLWIKATLDMRDPNVDEQNRIALLNHDKLHQLALKEYESKRMCLRCSEFYFEEVCLEFSNPLVPHVGASVTYPGGSKKCPFCAEEVKIEAVLCKHCRSKLSDIEDSI